MPDRFWSGCDAMEFEVRGKPLIARGEGESALRLGLARGGPRPEVTGSSCEIGGGTGLESSRLIAVNTAMHEGDSATSPGLPALVRPSCRRTCGGGLNAALWRGTGFRRAGSGGEPPAVAPEGRAAIRSVLSLRRNPRRWVRPWRAFKLCVAVADAPAAECRGEAATRRGAGKDDPVAPASAAPANANAAEATKAAMISPSFTNSRLLCAKRYRGTSSDHCYPALRRRVPEEVLAAIRASAAAIS